MVKRLFVVGAALAFLLIAACGGGSSGSTSTARLAPAAVATRGSSGPSISLDPKQGPPATEITVTGTGWPAGMTVEITGDVASGATAKPYATARASANGSFQTQFRLEKSPTGETLAVGPFEVVAQTGNTRAQASFQVQTARPVPVPGGG